MQPELMRSRVYTNEHGQLAVKFTLSPQAPHFLIQFSL